jgi:hypothetical protein
MLNRVQLDEDWVKGHYRKGAALMALERPLDALPHLREVRLDSYDYMEHTKHNVHGPCGSMEHTMIIMDLWSLRSTHWARARAPSTLKKKMKELWVYMGTGLGAFSAYKLYRT